MAASLFKSRKRRTGRRDRETRPLVLGIPVANKIADLRIGRGVVSMARPANVGDVVRVDHFVEAVLISSHPLLVELLRDVRERVTSPWNPHQNLFAARGRNPPERPILPGLHKCANAIEEVRRAGKIAYACLRHRSYRSPRVSGHVAHHGGIDFDAALLTELRSVLEESQQFFGAAESGELIRIRSLRRDLTLANGLDEGFLFGLRPPGHEEVAAP